MMKQRINKMAAVFIASIFALSGLGMAYAAWTDTITITGTVDTGELKWEIVPGTQSQKPEPDWNCFFNLETGTRVQMNKDVADTTVVIENVDHPHLMTVTIDNAYPYYYDHIAFQVHYYGNIPARIWKVNFLVDDMIVDTLWYNDWAAGNTYVYLNLDGEPGDDVEIWWGDNFGFQMHNCMTLDISFDILVLQPAPQDDTLEFDIEFVCIQWNKYTPGP